MKAIALPMVLLMLTATLAGCTGGDPDGGDGTDGIDLETLNQLIEDNLEDFLNNTSVTVNQDLHYYNNTTVNNHYHNNTTVNEGSDVTENNFQTDYTNYTLGQMGNGSVGSGEILFVMHMEFTAEDLAPDLVPRSDADPRTLIYDYTKNFTGYVWVDGNGTNTTGYYEQAFISITHQIPCSIFYILEDSYWESNDTGASGGYVNFWESPWLYYNYFQWYTDGYYNQTSSGATSNMTLDDYYDAGFMSESICNPEWVPWIAHDMTVNIGNITVPQGYMISVGVTEYYHLWGEVSNENESGTAAEAGSFSGFNYDNLEFVKQSGMVTFNSVSSYGGWDELILSMDLNLYKFWETTVISITILYSFTPVVPVN
ncbi:MAG: hypothetical protein ABGX29_05005 [Candidatus Poseidoniia archaeon]